MKEMKSLKYIAVIMFVLFQIEKGYSQPTDYDDFYKIINTIPDEKVFGKLMVYQRQDPYFANTYMQLGIVTHRLMLKADPLKQYEEAMKWADYGTLYLSLYTHYITENESRSNREFYANVPLVKTDNKFTNQDLIQFAKDKSKKIEIYRDSLRLVYKTLQKSKEIYGKSIELYKDLNNRFKNQNEAWLQTNDKVVEETKQLKQLFDSTVFYFNLYSDFIKIFPLKDYHQKYTLKPIKTFRLDGLTNSNFLAQEFEIWDFGAWVNEYLSVYNTDIIPLRQEIDKINQWYTNNEQALLERTIDAKNIPQSIYDEKFIFKLGKYDNNSLVRELLAYRNSKYKFLLEFNDPLNSPADNQVDILPRKARYYEQLKETKLISDSLLIVFESAISPERINRFSDFFNGSYGGEKGLMGYTNQQKDELNKILTNSFNNLKYFLKFQKEAYNNIAFTKYKTDSIPTFIVTSDYTGRYRTNEVFRSSGKPQYLAGMDISKNTASPFIAYLDKNKMVKWYKQAEKPITIAKDATTPVFTKIKGFSNGCMGIYSKISPEIVNTLVKLDSTGKELLRSVLPVKSYPVYLNYDDINQKTLLAFKGSNSTKSEELEQLTIIRTDSIGGIKWKNEFFLAGNIIDIVKTEGDYQVFLNYKSYIIQGNPSAPNPTGAQWGVLIVNIDDSGVIKNIVPVIQPYSYYVTDIIKLSGQSICLIGYKSIFGDIDSPLYFSITNSNGKIVYSN